MQMAVADYVAASTEAASLLCQSFAKNVVKSLAKISSKQVNM